MIEEIEKQQLAKAQVVFFIEAKIKAEKVLNSLKYLEKKTKKTKQSREVIKSLEDFIKCNLSNPAIIAKHKKVMDVLAKYTNQKVSDTNEVR